jgi:hypothetical protein
VYDFWLSPGISHPTGNKSDIKRERLGPDIYFSHMAQVIEKTQTDAYIDGFRLKFAWSEYPIVCKVAFCT